MARRKRRNLRKNFGGMSKAQYEKAYPLVVGMLAGYALKVAGMKLPFLPE